jgi:hypothetical protein
LTSDRSGERFGIGFVVYGDGAALSLAFAASASAAAAMCEEVFGLTVGAEGCGFGGNGGGARSGSELSHLRNSLVASVIVMMYSTAHCADASKHLHWNMSQSIKGTCVPDELTVSRTISR